MHTITNAIFAAEFFGILMLLIMQYGLWFESKGRSPKKSAFSDLVISVIIAVTVDCVTYFPLDWTNLYYLRYALSLAAMIVPFNTCVLFLRYIFLYVTDKVRFAWKYFVIGAAICGIGVICTVLYGLQGRLFYFENGIYTVGDFYEGYLLFYVALLIYTATVIGINRKQLGIHDAIAASMFIIVPMIALVINVIWTELEFSIASIPIAIFIIYTMLQGEQEDNLISSEAKTMQLAHSDELTGLQNRLAFNEACDSMGGDGFIGVIFTDVNGLKYANDHYGHKAGDSLLQQFSEILQACFRKNDIFRISGDEFVVLLREIPKETFDRKAQSLRKMLNERQPPLASIGCVHGVESQTHMLLDMAEKKMYEDKKRVHEQYPQFERQ